MFMLPSRSMITFQQESTLFTYRVAGVVLHNNAVLCEQSYDKTFWHLPGGRAELGESSLEGLIREMHEELGITINVVRLLHIVENLFTHNSIFHHILELHYLMTFPSDAYLYTDPGPFPRTDNDLQLHFAWLPLAELEHLPVYPTFLRSGLLSLPVCPVHIIDSDK
jgi:8-oxo-dGTP pyrophosphatase MutT (NUDIX family)